MVHHILGFTVRKPLPCRATRWNPCAKQQFVSSTMVCLYWIHSWAKTLMTVCVIRTDLDTDSLHSLITPLSVTPVPSTVSLITGPIPGFTVRRLLSLVTSPGETNVPGDGLFFLPWHPCTWIHGQAQDFWLPPKGLLEGPIHSLYSQITPLGVTPVPSTVFPMRNIPPVCFCFVF